MAVGHFNSAKASKSPTDLSRGEGVEKQRSSGWSIGSGVGGETSHQNPGKFTFSFHSHGPVGSQSSVFAYLVARDLPDSKACLLHYNKLLEMQDSVGHVWLGETSRFGWLGS